MNKCACLAVAVSSSVLGQEIGVQQIVNGGAEAGDMTGWVETGVEVVRAEGFHSGFGAYTFTGGPGPAQSQGALQIVDINALVSDVDAGELKVQFSVFIQSLQNQGGTLVDVGTVRVAFYRQDNSEIVFARRVFSDPPDSIPDWRLYGFLDVVPFGTRYIEIYLDAERNAGEGTDCFFDQVSLFFRGCSIADLASPLGSVDLADVSEFVSRFLLQELSVDFNEDGVVDLQDLIAFVDTFQNSCI